VPEVYVLRPVAPDDVDTLRTVAALAEQSAGHPVLGDSVWRDLDAPSTATALVVARDGSNVLGVLHVGPSASPTAPGVRLSVAVAPGAPVGEVGRSLVETALADARGRDGGPVELLVFGADETWDTVASDLGLRPARDLLQLRMPLPAAAPRWPPAVRVRAFEPGIDEDEWLTVNNRAFADDPDQGGWDRDTLLGREREPWFDPAGFLLAFDERGLAGFCWTRLHPPTPPLVVETVGEIYVIGVDPDRQGTGLGRALVLGGLGDLHERRGATIGMLFVDAGNEPAVSLYLSMGFSRARVDRTYTCDR
jgi:mycothiol synthase